MTVDLKPETKQLVDEEIESGHFESLDDLITRSVLFFRGHEHNGDSEKRSFGSREQAFASMLEICKRTKPDPDDLTVVDYIRADRDR